MINAILAIALRHRLFVVLFACFLMGYGAWLSRQMPVDVFPDLNRPTVSVLTEAHGLAPEEVETLVTLPLETALNGAPGVLRVRSTSGVGLSVINVEFDWESEPHHNRQIVAEKLQSISQQLPKGITPVMGPMSSIMGEILLIGLTGGPETSPSELRSLADWIIRPRLMAIPGIAQIIPMGGGVKQYQVIIDPLKLKHFSISLQEVETAIAGSTGSSTGGFIEQQGQEYLIRNIARAESLADVAQTAVAYRHGLPIRLDQVATVQFGTQVKRGEAGVNGQPAVIMTVQKQPGKMTLELTKQVEKALDELRPSLPKDVTLMPDLFRQANFIESAIFNVKEALLHGAVLVAIVLFAFLLNTRTTLITLTAIPLSFAVTAIVLDRFGISINTMTLGGLAIAIGELVDDAIVDVENVYRRLKENRQRENPLPALEVIYRASSEIRSSIVFATIIVVLVFIPLFAMGGIEGRLFTPLGVSYIVAILASLLVSLTLTPVLCYYLLPQAKILAREGDTWLVRHLKAWNTHWLKVTLPNPKFALILTGILAIATFSLIPFMGRTFLPPFNEGTATIGLFSTPGTNLSESNKIAIAAERLLLGVPEVVHVSHRTGRAELDEHAEGPHYTELDVDLKSSKRSREEVLNDLRTRLTTLPGIVTNIGQPISHRLDHLLSGIRAEVAIKLFGSDLDTLRAKATEIERAIAPIKGVVDLQIEKQTLIPQVAIRVDRAAALRYGIPPAHVSDWLETALNGKIVSQVLEEQRIYNLVLKLPDDEKQHLDKLSELLIDTPSGQKVPLGAIAQITNSQGPNQINRENMQRRIVIFCNVSGRDLGSVVTEIRRIIPEKVTMPTGYFITYGGQFESQQSATRQIAILSVFSLIGMFMTLFALFRSVRQVLLVMLNIPLSLIGGIIALCLSGGVLSVASLVGFVTLSGIAARNGIMKIAHYRHLMEEEGEAFSAEMIIRGSNERLVPVLMTASTALFALIPLALSAGAPGKEILQPVAVVILGGLISSTLLDTLLTPTLFYRYGRDRSSSS